MTVIPVSMPPTRLTPPCLLSPAARCFPVSGAWIILDPKSGKCLFVAQAMLWARDAWPAFPGDLILFSSIRSSRGRYLSLYAAAWGPLPNSKEPRQFPFPPPSRAARGADSRRVALAHFCPAAGASPPLLRAPPPAQVTSVEVSFVQSPRCSCFPPQRDSLFSFLS